MDEEHNICSERYGGRGCIIVLQSYWAVIIYIEFFHSRKLWASVNWLSLFIMMLLTLKEAPIYRSWVSACVQSFTARNWQMRPKQINKEKNAFLYCNCIHWTPNPISAFVLMLYMHKSLVCIAIGSHCCIILIMKLGILIIILIITLGIEHYDRLNLNLCQHFSW